jgi:exosortase A-associated hydrolase 1
MSFRETAIGFACEGEKLIGVVAEPELPARVGVVIAVGGPQYRAGSHRQFTLLARHLAASGYAVLRFDYRGMGDSTGEPVDFESATPDIAAAVDALMTHVPALRRVVLWGLCDAASAALLYLRETRDSRIAGLCLLNPWVRSETTYARTEVKHYYARRLLDKAFWLKLLKGGVQVGRALREATDKLRVGFGSQGSHVASTVLPFQRRMADAVGHFGGPVLLILSENDLTAREFREYAAGESNWRRDTESGRIRRIDVAGADHTFSTAAWRDQVASLCAEWLGEVELRVCMPDTQARSAA